MTSMSCQTGHPSDEHGPAWVGTAPGQAERVIARLWVDRCPVCPAVDTEPTERAGRPVRQCPCCGSAWALDGDEWQCMPGARLRESADHGSGKGARERRARAARGELPASVRVEPDRLYDSGEVAALLDVQRSSVGRMVRRGSWPEADRRIGNRPAWYGSTIEHAVAHPPRRGRPPAQP
jgi:Zn-finger nucleic acid-binding protein/predicted DNA-binding transcriptional regulator AlpA